MINPQWPELPMSRTNFHGPKDVRAIEVRLYFADTNVAEVLLSCSHRYVDKTPLICSHSIIVAEALLMCRHSICS